MQTPIGNLEIKESPEGVEALFEVEEREAKATTPRCHAGVHASVGGQHPRENAKRAREGGYPRENIKLEQQLAAYFSGNLTTFSIPLNLCGTPFQKRVWQALLEIPYGEVRTYGEIAKAVGCGSARAVGTAIGKNPVPIIVPCHRVVAAKSIGGYSAFGGNKTKEFLLNLEKENRGTTL